MLNFTLNSSFFKQASRFTSVIIKTYRTNTKYHRNIRQNKKTNRFTSTIVEPVGVERLYEINIPNTKQIIDISTDVIVTFLKVFTICIADIVGKIIKLEINNAPINLIPKTTTTEHSIAKITLYKSVFTPTDFANSSSNVNAKILL